MNCGALASAISWMYPATGCVPLRALACGYGMVPRYAWCRFATSCPPSDELWRSCERYIMDVSCHRLRAAPPDFAFCSAVVFEALACGYGMVPRYAWCRFATMSYPSGELWFHAPRGVASRRCPTFRVNYGFMFRVVSLRDDIRPSRPWQGQGCPCYLCNVTKVLRCRGATPLDDFCFLGFVGTMMQKFGSLLMR